MVKPGYGKNISSVKNKEVLASARMAPNSSSNSVTSDYNSEYSLGVHEAESTPRKMTKSNSTIIQDLNNNTKRIGSFFISGKNLIIEGN